MADHTGGSSDTIVLDDKPMQQLQEPPPVPGYVQQINKLSNTVISSATIALIRALALRPSAKSEPPANLPPWYADQYKARASWQAFLRQYGRDTIILTGASYVMDAVEYAMKTIRGTDKDPANKMMGGVAAGGLLGVMWYPANSTGRAVMSASGALVGYMAYSLEQSTKVLLLDQQRRLEKDLLHKSDADVRPDLDAAYLRQLLRMKQRQLVVEQKHEQERIRQGYEQWKQQAKAGGTAAGMPPQRPARDLAAEERRGWQLPSGSSGAGMSGTVGDVGGAGAGGGGFPSQGAVGGFGGRPSGDSFSGLGGGGSGRGDQGGVLRITDDDYQSAPTDGGLGGSGAGGGAKWVKKQPRGDSDWLVINEDQDAK